MRRTNAAPRWVEGAQRYQARRGPIAHHDGTCDAVYPGTSNDRDGRCVLAEGHNGAHVYRGRGPTRKPTRKQAYQAERDERAERKRLARLVLRREQRKRAARIF
jgi:hypothetical protein